MDFPEKIVSHAPEGLQRYIDDQEHPEPADVSSPPESWLISATAIGAGVGTRKLLTKLWTGTRGQKPPQNPAAAGVSWTDALIWAAAVGATIGVARVITRRTATVAARRWTR